MYLADAVIINHNPIRTGRVRVKVQLSHRIRCVAAPRCNAMRTATHPTRGAVPCRAARRRNALDLMWKSPNWGNGKWSSSCTLEDVLKLLGKDLYVGYVYTTCIGHIPETATRENFHSANFMAFRRLRVDPRPETDRFNFQLLEAWSFSSCALTWFQSLSACFTVQRIHLLTTCTCFYQIGTWVSFEFQNKQNCLHHGRWYQYSELVGKNCFYRAMHYSAKRGLAIACRPSGCLSICDVGGSWPHR